MTMITEGRLSDSPYIDAVMHGHTLSAGSTIRPGEIHWHMVFVRVGNQMHPLITGPLTTSGRAQWGADAEILWIKFKLGTYMPHLPAKHFLDDETMLPKATSRKFWLKGSAWQFPDYENVDTFVNRLARDEILMFDPVVRDALDDRATKISARTVRERFARATGLTQVHVRQMQRAERAAGLLAQGMPILDVVDAVGYFDQPHLTRSLKQYIGHTPLQILRKETDGVASLQYDAPELEDHAIRLAEAQ